MYSCGIFVGDIRGYPVKKLDAKLKMGSDAFKFDKTSLRIAKIGLQICTLLPQQRLNANVGKFGCIISLKNNQLAWFFFFGHPVVLASFLI